MPHDEIFRCYFHSHRQAKRKANFVLNSLQSSLVGSSLKEPWSGLPGLDSRKLTEPRKTGTSWPHCHACRYLRKTEGEDPALCHLLSSPQPPGEHCPHAEVQALGDEHCADRALGRPLLGLAAVFLQVPSGAKDCGPHTSSFAQERLHGPLGGRQWLKPQKEGQGIAAFWTLVLGGRRVAVGREREGSMRRERGPVQGARRSGAGRMCVESDVALCPCGPDSHQRRSRAGNLTVWPERPASPSTTPVSPTNPRTPSPAGLCLVGGGCGLAWGGMSCLGQRGDKPRPGT